MEQKLNSSTNVEGLTSSPTITNAMLGDILGDWEVVDGKKVQSRMQVFFNDKLGQWMLDCSSEQDKSTSYALFKEIEDFEYEIIGSIYEK